MQVQRLGVTSFVQTIRGSFVQQIEPAKDATRMEEVDKLVVNCLTHRLTTAEFNRGLGEAGGAFEDCFFGSRRPVQGAAEEMVL
jgi:hypothetical protein